MHNLVLSLGSNIGKKEENILKSYKFIEEKIGLILNKSSFYYSKPWGFYSENDFVNSCILVKTTFKPLIILDITKDIEFQMGRGEKSKNEYNDRIIDIDILYYDNIILNNKDLVIPHPFLYDRDFVLIPLKEIYFDFIDPLKNIKISEL